MGLPGFFAWILKKYANNILLEKLKNNPKYLYVDANCLFHPECFTVLEISKNTNKNELKKLMFERIVLYLDFIEKYVSPTDKMYIAVDGSAPLAKIMQQRRRRYKSEIDNNLKAKIKNKFNVNSTHIWNNTCITPGTEFMEELHEYILNHYSQKKSNIKYVYSSYHTPGEGEHKILQDIKKNTDINDDIVIYGLDADLIFLSMASNRNNIYLFREQLLFKTKIDNTKKNEIEREMIYVSIGETKKSYNDDIIYKINNISKNKFNHFDDYSNDLIFICFLLGNDFLPHFPSIDIHTGGLDELLSSYIHVLLLLKTQLVIIDDKGVNINNVFLQMLLENMGDKEEYFFQNILPVSVEKNKRRKCLEKDEYKIEIWNLENLKNINNINNIDNYDILNLGFGDKNLWKYKYYQHHFSLTNSQDYYIENICKMYLEGIVWIATYYFKECIDWRWAYVCHHAPFVSDLAKYMRKYNIRNIVFEKKENIPIMSQLLAVLPPSCSYYLPNSYAKLMTNMNSNIIDLFPTSVKLDTLHKSQLYQCVPLIPYLDINRILNETHSIKLDEKEEKRNTIFDDYIIYTAEDVK